MKKALIAILLSVTMLILSLSACSQTKSSLSDQPTPSLNSSSTSSTTEDTKMESMILDKLQGHHSIDIVLSAQHTREEWNVTMNRMIARGAPITEQEKLVIIDWLITRQK